MQYYEHDLNSVEDYLHHRSPYLLVDRIVSVTAKEIQTEKLNLIQVELLRRSQQPQPGIEPEELRHLTRLTINGISAGMRTSG